MEQNAIVRWGHFRNQPYKNELMWFHTIFNQKRVYNFHNNLIFCEHRKNEKYRLFMFAHQIYIYIYHIFSTAFHFKIHIWQRKALGIRRKLSVPLSITDTCSRHLHVRFQIHRRPNNIWMMIHCIDTVFSLMIQ